MAAIRLSYYEGKRSFVSRLDPRTKLLYIGWVFVMIMVFSHPAYQALPLLTIIVAGLLGDLSFWRLVKAGRFGIYVGLVSWLLWVLFLQHQGAPIVRVGPLSITERGVLVGLSVALRIVLVLLAFLIVAMTTPNRDLIAGLHGLRVPLAFAMAVGLILRLLPQLQAEHASIMEAQQSRAAEFDAGNLLQRINKHSAYAIPLSLRTLKIVSDLSIALDARAFDPYARRTFVRAPRRTRADVAILIFFAITAAAALALRLLGYGGAP